jgi:phosphonate degradation associated HDIG domain protein
MSDIIDRILRTFDQRGDLAYGGEAVTQRQHALQAATLAAAEQAGPRLVAAALLHDIGHILDADELPAGTDTDLDDAHEERAYGWLLRHFGPPVADPVRLHVAAKRYLCTVDPAYAGKLSPTSHKSYLDQGGPMNAEERAAFEAEPHFEESLRLRRWDDLAKDPSMATLRIPAFRPALEQALLA